MAIGELTLKVGVCDSCGRQVLPNEEGNITGFVGEVENTTSGKIVEFFACSLPHVGKSVTKLMRPLEDPDLDPDAVPASHLVAAM